MQRYGVLKYDASIFQFICVKNVLYNIYLPFSVVFTGIYAVFLCMLTYLEAYYSR